MLLNKIDINLTKAQNKMHKLVNILCTNLLSFQNKFLLSIKCWLHTKMEKL